MKVKIFADSTCDLSPELQKKYDIGIIPLHIEKGGQEYRDGVEITPKDIFEYVESGKGICRTMAVNTDEYDKCYRAALEDYDGIVHLTISSDFSACFQNACLAARELENVYPVDSRNLSTGIGHLAIDAAIMAQQGMEPQEIKEALEEMSPKLESSFVISTLKYLHKGGRCSSVAALGANILQLKPCIEVVDGKMDVGKKYRGSFEKVLKQYVEGRLKGREDIDYKRIFITHTCTNNGPVQAVREYVESLASFEEIIETDAGCTISNHCGPDTLGILFYRK